MDIRTKRIYDDPDPDDGRRVLVDRLWPRGVSKEDAGLDLWLRDVAPSSSLRDWYDHDVERWDEFRSRYRAELDDRTVHIETLCDVVSDGTVTLLYAAADREHNNAVVLAAYLEEDVPEGRRTETITSGDVIHDRGDPRNRYVESDRPVPIENRTNISGGTHRRIDRLHPPMGGFPTPFGQDDDLFDEYDEFVPEHIPSPGDFLADQDVLTDDRHLAFHELTQDLFEARKVYDMTFNYNLARLNLDTRHKNAGYRYAEESEDRSVLRAEFTPTTPFCPQTHTLTIGSFRAWNGLSDRHQYDLVRVRADRMHHQADQINEQLATIEDRYRETGDVEAAADARESLGANPMERAMEDEEPSRGGQAPF